jgi:hypothetical protein
VVIYVTKVHCHVTAGSAKVQSELPVTPTHWHCTAETAPDDMGRKRVNHRHLSLI